MFSRKELALINEMVEVNGIEHLPPLADIINRPDEMDDEYSPRQYDYLADVNSPDLVESDGSVYWPTFNLSDEDLELQRIQEYSPMELFPSEDSPPPASTPQTSPPPTPPPAQGPMWPVIDISEDTIDLTIDTPPSSPLTDWSSVSYSSSSSSSGSSPGSSSPVEDIPIEDLYTNPTPSTSGYVKDIVNPPLSKM